MIYLETSWVWDIVHLGHLILMLNELFLVVSVEVLWETFSFHSFSFGFGGEGSISDQEWFVLGLVGGFKIKLVGLVMIDFK